ncbi:DNA primase [Clostridia bacterium]|nr:DNA primase [Clostridia bacterium]
MRYAQNVIDEIMHGNNIIDVIGGHTRLKQNGVQYVGLCPFHSEKTPSFSVNAAKQVYYCFGCGESGNVYGFLMRKENLSFYEAVRELAKRIHYKLPEAELSADEKEVIRKKDIIYEINKLSARFFYEQLIGAEGEIARNYLNLRGLSNRTCVLFGLGYSCEKWDLLLNFLKSKGYDVPTIEMAGLAKHNDSGQVYDRFRGRLMFPIIDVLDRIVGFGGRVLGADEPKYLNSPDTLVFDKSRNLYGINFAKKSGKGEFILCEGYMDVIALHRFGFNNAVASLGTSFNENHAKVLKRYVSRAVLLFDSDAAGQKAAARAIPVLETAGVACRVLAVPNAKDPDEFLTNFGAEAFSEILETAKDSVTYTINSIKNKYNLKDTAEKVNFTNEAVKFLAGRTSELEKNIYAQTVAQISDLPEDVVRREVAKQSTPPVIIPKREIYKKTPQVQDRAVGAFISILTNDTRLIPIVQNYISPEELINPVHKVLLEEIYKKQGESISEAELINIGENYEEQKIISAIFAKPLEISDDKKEQTLNQILKEVKKQYIEYSSRQLTDPEDVEKLAVRKRNLTELNIKLPYC